jgi:acyl-CoA reductase-like NAD-dependent aldehyde dehydrogenase
MSPISSAKKLNASLTEIFMLIDGQRRAASETHEVRDPYSGDVADVFRTVSSGRFGLQTGIFTASIELAIRAVRGLRTGGVILNGSSTWRTDQLTYGGVKDSGIGREGPRCSIREMTEERMVLFNY